MKTYFYQSAENPLRLVGNHGHDRKTNQIDLKFGKMFMELQTLLYIIVVFALFLFRKKQIKVFL